MKDTKVIAAFPACGKTYYFENKEKDITVLDSDSSKFSWMFRKRTDEELEALKKEWDSVPHLLDGEGYINKIKNEEIKVRNPDFPKNYIEHIKENIGKVDYIFVSTHNIVRNALKEANIDFILVFPDQSLKEEWIGRCFLRGSGETFCKLVANQWDNWMTQMYEEILDSDRKYYILQHGKYLSDAMKYIG